MFLELLVLGLVVLVAASKNKGYNELEHVLKK
jgi:general stress protein CsbA